MTTTLATRYEIGVECVEALIGACEDEREAIDNEVGLEILGDGSATDVFIRKLDAVRYHMEAAYRQQPGVAVLRENNEEGA
jgi:hypothetical protein